MHHVVPRHAQWLAEVQAGCLPVSFMADLKALAHSEGLWNLFLPGLRDDEPGTRLSNLEYAPLAEIKGRIPWASEVFNCCAPDTGNVQTLIRRDGEQYVLNGRKWFITNAFHPQCRLLIVMGKTDPEAAPHRQQSMLLVPFDTPGVQVLRNIPMLNYVSAEGHAEIVWRDVRVPCDHLLGQDGDGFMMAQARMGPGRAHHCMRAIGMAKLALQQLLERCQERCDFGRYLAQYANIGESRLDI